MTDRKVRETAPRTGVELIVSERQRQVEKEHWSAEHDDGHSGEELAWAAACYAAPGRIYFQSHHADGVCFADPWPWDDSDDKRKTHGSNFVDNLPADVGGRVRMLVKAGALIAAEIDRLQRAP
jgi:hypothetical protein